MSHEGNYSIVDKNSLNISKYLVANFSSNVPNTNRRLMSEVKDTPASALIPTHIYIGAVLCLVIYPMAT